MGKIRIKTLGVEEIEEKQKVDAQKRRDLKKQKKPGTDKSTGKDMEIKESQTVKSGRKGGERMVQIGVSDEDIKKQEAAEKALKKSEKTTENESKEDAKNLPPQIKRQKRVGANQKKAKAKIDSTKKYPIEEAVKLVKSISYAKFDEAIELHLKVKEQGLKGKAMLPHGTGKEVRIAIADEAVLKKIESGKIDFDILISTPAFMPKLVPFAKTLGPKGLMPNPKKGTVADNPKEAEKKLKGGAIQFKTESKAPLIHQIVGRVSFKDEQLVENINAMLDAVKEKNITIAYLAATMTPSVKLDLN